MDTWLTSLKTETPQEGYELAILLARKAVNYTQPSADIREKIRPKYEDSPDSLTFIAQVVAVHFQTVASANNYWQ